MRARNIGAPARTLSAFFRVTRLQQQDEKNTLVRAHVHVYVDAGDVERDN